VEDPWEKARLPGVAFLVVLAAGTVAYHALGLGWFDSFYQTLITVSTVGYGEIGIVVTPAYRMVSTLLILFGVGVGVYWVGVVFEAVMEGRLTDHVGMSRMRKTIMEASGHTIVCGFGRVGRTIAEQLTEAGEVVVVVDCRDEIRQDYEGLLVVGEATNDEVLEAAGVRRARSLVVALDSKGDNLFVTLSARALNPSLFIVARAVADTTAEKLVHAGADRVVSPYEIGAGRMASFVLQPNVADFLSETMADGSFQVRLGEIKVEAGSGLVDVPLRSTPFLEETGLTLLALRKCDGSFSQQRDGSCIPGAGERLIVLGTPEQHRAAEKWVRNPQ